MHRTQKDAPVIQALGLQTNINRRNECYIYYFYGFYFQFLVVFLLIQKIEMF